MNTLKGLIAALVVALLAVPSPAQEVDLAPEDFVVGATTGMGYTYKADGFFWRGGQRFTRRTFRQFQSVPYGCCGQYRTQSYVQAVYTPAPVPPVNNVVVNNVIQAPKYAPGWESRAIELLKKRDDLNAYLLTVDKLNSTAIQGPGYVATGTTLYSRGGYSALNQQLYSMLDVNLGLQQAARLTQNAQQLSGDSLATFQGIVQGQSQMVERVAVIQALASGSQLPPVSVQTTATASPAAPPNVFGAERAAIMPRAADGALEGVWAQSCAVCHTGPAAKNGFTLQKWQSLGKAQKIRLFQARLDPATAKPADQMPRDASGVGHPLPEETLRKSFFADILATPNG